MKYTLDKSEIEELLRNNSVKINEQSNLELLKDSLIINNDGNIFKLTKATFYFEKQEIEQKFKVEFLKSLVCKHLNLKKNEVLFVSDSENDTVFRINLFPQEEIYIIVCHRNSAILTSKDFYTEIIIEEHSNTVGPYKRLSNSDYYFRWSYID